MARQTTKNKTFKILLLAETTYHFGRGIVEGVNYYSFEKNWEIAFEPRGISEPLPNWVQKWKGDGVISRLVDPASMQTVRDLAIPVVELAGDGQEFRADVIVDEVKLAKMAADHLTGCGFRRFAVHSYGKSWWSTSRENAFDEEMERRGFKCERIQPLANAQALPLPQWSTAEQDRLRKWLIKLSRPIGIFVVNDFQARDVLLTCTQLGISVPHDVAILGVDDDRWFCKFLVPSLSSIDANGFLTGYRAAELLDRLMNGEKRPDTPVLVPPLHVTARQSTNSIAVDDPDIAAAIQYIRKFAASRITVAELVREIGLSQKTLERHFKNFLRRTPEQEILRVRIEHAKEMLRETNYAVGVISAKSGFSTPAHFIHIFKRETGTTPNKYRLSVRTQ